MKNKKSRSKTRTYAMEIIYQWLHNDTPVSEVLDRYETKYAVDIVYLRDVVEGALSKRPEIDAMIEPTLANRSLDEITHIEYAILLIACYELMHQYDIPYKVVINEALNIAKQYGAQDAHKFINSVLDIVAKEVRGLECQDD